MIKKCFIRALALLLPIFLFSCAAVPNPDYDFMGRFQKGETRQTISLIKNDDPYYEFDFSADGSMKATHVDMYRMILSSKIPFIWRLLGIPVRKTKYDFIAFAYQNDQLIFCGTPDDFKKSVNTEITSIGTRLNDELLKEF